MTTKLRIKMGVVEVEYEGAEDFSKDELLAIISKVADLRGGAGGGSGGESNGGGSGDDLSAGGTPVNAGSTGQIQGTTATLAAKLKANSGTELILAACARFTFVLGQPEIKRKQILDEMRSASGYYKNSYADNLTKYLRTLVKSGALIEPSQGAYALGANKREQLEKQLA